MKVHAIESGPCPKCGVILDVSKNVDKSTLAPESGDLIVCYHCEAVLTYDAELGVSLMTAGEIAKLSRTEKESLTLAVLKIRAHKESGLPLRMLGMTQ